MKATAETYVAPVVAGLVALVTLIGLIGPAVKSPTPHGIPIGIVAQPGSSTPVAVSVNGPFTVTPYDSEKAARDAIDSRDIDGALLLGPTGPHLIVAGAEGDGVAGVIVGAFTALFQKQSVPLTVETVHPFASGDPHGLILFFAVLAILVGTLIAQALVGLRPGARLGGRLLAVVAFAVLAGPAAMGMATLVAGDYGAGVWAAAALLALGSAAVGAVVAGAAGLLGRPGVGLAALVAVLLDLVCSGGPIGSQLLPDAYRWLAPAMPAGQLYSSMRGVLYFGGAGVATPVLVMLGWLVVGLVLLAVGDLAARRSAATRLVAAHGANR